MNTKQTNLIRHPWQVPVSIQVLETHAANNVTYLGELAVHCETSFPMGTKVMLDIQIPDTDAKLSGKIVWSYQSEHGYLLGISFQSQSEA
ncbi:MAG: hypothetical protein Q9M21_06715, partial [Mariprofundaceae bacterium]|nr:hypothetical protein [Mariprofundaceae bacterium]